MTTKPTEPATEVEEKEKEFFPFSHKTIFRHLMEDDEVAREVISIILGRKVRKAAYCIAEYDVRPTVKSKGIRLDIYFENDDNVYDVEMQVSPPRDLGRRCRYYQSSLDIDMLKTGEDYENMKNSYIIFLCRFNPSDTDQIEPISIYEPVRTNDPTCKVGDALKLDTGTKTIICYTKAYEKLDRKTHRNLHDLLEYIATQKVENDNPFIKKIDNMVRYANQDEEIRSEAKMYDLEIRDAEVRTEEKVRTEERQATKETLTQFLERNRDKLQTQQQEELENIIKSYEVAKQC